MQEFMRYQTGLILMLGFGMAFFSFFQKNKDDESQDLPWNNLPSIYGFISKNLDGKGNLKPEAEALPDERRRYKDEKLRWVAGGLDGAFGHHGAGEENMTDDIVVLVKAISEKDDLKKKIKLYHILAEDNLMDYIDTALEKIVASNISIEPYLHEYARWLAFKSPDRGSVKFGVALLGLIGDEADIEGIITLGKHEEFTLFSAVAITNTIEDSQNALWELAQSVNGWGRIHIVERLSDTDNPAIQDWLLREGYKNSIMYEYLAYICATSGKLKARLAGDDVDDRLIVSAGDILAALVNGGPAEDMDDYQDGAEVARLYVDHVANFADLSLSNFLVLNSLRDYLTQQDKDWTKLRNHGWGESLRRELEVRITKIISDPRWPEIVEENKHTNDAQVFWTVNTSAEVLGIDLWDVHWQRLHKDTADSGNWYRVMQAANPDRIDDILLFAEENLPLKEMATGPEDSVGIGPEYNNHSCLDFILQDLRSYPEKGYSLIRVGLRSPVVRNRNMAIMAFAEWDRDKWPADARQMIEKSVAEEPDDNVRKKMENLLAGNEI